MPYKDIDAARRYQRRYRAQHCGTHRTVPERCTQSQRGYDILRRATAARARIKLAQRKKAGLPTLKVGRPRGLHILIGPRGTVERAVIRELQRDFAWAMKRADVSFWGRINNERVQDIKRRILAEDVPEPVYMTTDERINAAWAKRREKRRGTLQNDT